MSAFLSLSALKQTYLGHRISSDIMPAIANGLHASKRLPIKTQKVWLVSQFEFSVTNATARETTFAHL